jgi:hypothetical protein
MKFTKFTTQQIKDFLANPPCEIKWKEVIGDILPNNAQGHAEVTLRCSCGNIKTVRISGVLDQRPKSCGCMRRNVNLDGTFSNESSSRNKSKLYRVWCAMRERCRNPNTLAYKDYGGRGISVCTEWNMNFISFRDWALSNGYQENLTLDRRDNNGNYCPENCRWTTKTEQAKNRRSTHFVTIGPVTLCIKDWAKELGVQESTIHRRVRNGMTYEEAILTPKVDWYAPPIKGKQKNISQTFLVTIDGKTQTILKWCREVGIRVSAVQGRVRRGWELEQAILTPVQKSSKIVKHTEEVHQ